MGDGRGVPVAVGVLDGLGTKAVGSAVGLGVRVGVQVGLAVAVRVGVGLGVCVGVGEGVQVNMGVTVGVALDCGDGVTEGVTVSGVKVITGTGVAVSSAASEVWLCPTIGVREVVGDSPALDSGRRTRNSTRITTAAVATATMGIQGVRGIHGGLLRNGGTGTSWDGPPAVAT